MVFSPFGFAQGKPFRFAGLRPGRHARARGGRAVSAPTRSCGAEGGAYGSPNRSLQPVTVRTAGWAAATARARDGGGQKLDKAPYQLLAAALSPPRRSGVGESVRCCDAASDERMHLARNGTGGRSDRSRDTRPTRAGGRGGGRTRRSRHEGPSGVASSMGFPVSSELQRIQNGCSDLLIRCILWNLDRR